MNAACTIHHSVVARLAHEACASGHRVYVRYQAVRSTPVAIDKAYR